MGLLPLLSMEVRYACLLRRRTPVSESTLLSQLASVRTCVRPVRPNEPPPRSQPPLEATTHFGTFLQAGANKVYVVEPHGFLAKMAHAHVQRHTLICFEQENWAKLPMNVGLAERTKQVQLHVLIIKAASVTSKSVMP